MKRYFLLLLVLISFSGFAQTNLNNYKYVLVPEKFSFLKQNNQYRLNSLTKSLLEDKGFTAYFDNAELPTEIATNKCQALTVELLEKNTMFVTNITLLLKDCKGNIVYQSKQGKSREKEYNVSYNLALRDAFSSLSETKYAYTPAADEDVYRTNTKTPASQSAATAITTAAPQTAETFYAQPTATGYQLIDTAPKIILTLYKTSVSDYFIAANGNANGVFFKKNESWFFEYYKDGKLIAEKISVKF